MLKNISFLALASAMAFASTACIVVTDDTTTNDEVGDGDGDATTGDGDGDQTGDGDGDGDATGDGDGDATGDGDGDATGDGDGDAGPSCGWNPDGPYYECGFDGEDPAGVNPIACPAGLVDGDPCSNTGLTGEGCCDADGNNWYCAQGDVVFMADCSA